MMSDYVAIILNGLFTGIGVIFAHEFWDVVKGYRHKAKKILKNNFYIEEVEK
jgi:hypothetical protein